jgi:hypothetical protein
MIKPQRLFEILAFPVVIFLAGYAGNWVSNYSGFILPHGFAVDEWLWHHPMLETLEAEVSFGLFALVTAGFVAAATYVLLRFSPQPGPWWRIHLHLTSLWYVTTVLAAVAFAHCWGECDGAFIGMDRAATYAGVGGVIGNAVVVWKLSLRKHAA